MWDFVLYQANPHISEYVFLRILSSNSIRNLEGGKSRIVSAAYTIMKECDSKTIRENKIKAINQISSFAYVVETSVADTHDMVLLVEWGDLSSEFIS